MNKLRRSILTIIPIFSFFGVLFSQETSDRKGTFIDEKDSMQYEWVKVGDQIWMAENYAFLADSGCFVYRGRKRTVKKYGYLYTYDQAKALAPKGWHLPTEKEYWEMLHTIDQMKNGKAQNTKSNTKFESINELRDLLNLSYNGIYYEFDKEWIFGWWGFRSSRLWTSNLGHSSKGEVLNSCFFMSEFLKTAGIEFVFASSQVSMPVRYIKDR